MAQSALHLHMVIPPAPWTKAMEDGSVSIPGVTWDVNSNIQHAPDRFIATGGAHVGENGVRRLAIDIINGSPNRALPVYFGRELMQRNFVVRADSDLHRLEDLAGKRVSSRLTIQSGTGAAVLMVMEQAYGIDLHSIDWVMGDPDSLPTNRMKLKIRPAPLDDDSNYAMLLRGEVDAVMQTTGPRYRSLFGGDYIDKDVASHPGTRPLIEDPSVIAASYRKSKLYPISDVVTLTPELARAYPELPRQLVDAFSAANERSDHYRDADERALAKREIELLGEDVHVYGLGPNQRANVAAFLDFLYRMGAVERALQPEELFYPASI